MIMLQRIWKPAVKAGLSGSSSSSRNCDEAISLLVVLGCMLGVIGLTILVKLLVWFNL